MPSAAFLKPLGITLLIGAFLTAMSGLLWPSGPVERFGMELLYLLFAANVLMAMAFAVSDHPKLSVGERQAPLALALGGVALLVILGAWVVLSLSVGAAFAYQALVLLLAGRYQTRTS